MTKITVLGQTPEKKELKKIEFVKLLTQDLTTELASNKPHERCNIELICAGYGEFDIMFAYDKERSDGILYLGHFNDGVV